MSTTSSLGRKVPFGVASGLLGCLLMEFTVYVSTTTIMDFRTVAEILPAVFAGPIPTLISALLIGFGRIIFFHYNTVSTYALMNVALSAILCAIMSRLRTGPWIRWYWMFFSTTVTAILTFLLAIQTHKSSCRLQMMGCTNPSTMAETLYTSVRSPWREGAESPRPARCLRASVQLVQCPSLNQ